MAAASQPVDSTGMISVMFISDSDIRNCNNEC